MQTTATARYKPGLRDNHFLVMLFGGYMSQISLTARQRFREQRLGIRIQKGYARGRCPRLEQDVRILDGRRPGEGISIAMQSFDDVHVLAMKIDSELIEPTGAVETDVVDHHRISLPVADRFSVPGPVQVFQVRVLAAIGGNHAIARLRR